MVPEPLGVIRWVNAYEWLLVAHQYQLLKRLSAEGKPLRELLDCYSPATCSIADR